MPTTKHSMTTYIAVPLADDIDHVRAAARAEAIKRLGGEEGLSIISEATVGSADAPQLATTFSRIWEETTPDPETDA